MRRLRLKIALISGFVSTLAVFLSFSNEFHEFLCRWFDSCVVINFTPSLPPPNPSQTEDEKNNNRDNPPSSNEETQPVITSQDREDSPSPTPATNFTNEKADIYVSPTGIDTLESSSTKPTTNVTDKVDIYVSPTGIDTLESSSTTQTNIAQTVFVSNQGNNNNSGSQTSPFRSLTYALQQAQRIQGGDSSKVVAIQMDIGTYSSSSGESDTITIPPGISIKGLGDKTVLISGIKISSNVSLSNLQIKNGVLYIRGEDINDSSVNLSKIYLFNGSIYLSNNSSNLTDIITEVSYYYRVNSATIYIQKAKPRITNLEIKNVSERIDNAIYIDDSSSPSFVNLKLSTANIAIRNEGNINIDGLEIRENKIGIYNNGEITLNNLKASQNKYAAICNRGTIIIQGATFDNTPPKTSEQCPNIGSEPPIVVPDLAGDVQSVMISE